jgi:hypothetical protein
MNRYKENKTNESAGKSWLLVQHRNPPLGQEVATLVDQVKQVVSYAATFSAQRGFASGVYFYRIRAGDFVAMEKNDVGKVDKDKIEETISIIIHR